MHRLIFAVAAISVCSPAAASEWQLIGASYGSLGRSITYVDSSSVKEHAGRIVFRSREFYNADAAGFDNLLSTVEADCHTMQATIIRSTYLRGELKVGFGQQLAKVDYSNPETASHWILARLCGGRSLSNDVRDPRSDSHDLFNRDWAVGSDGLNIQEFGAVERTASANLNASAISGR